MKKYCIWGVVVVFLVAYGSLASLRHWRMETGLYDLGIYDQVVWQMSKGEHLYSSVIGLHPWGDHFTPSLYLLAPLYWVWRSPLVLLWTQVVIVVVGAIPIYWYAIKKTRDMWLGVVIAMAYLSFFGIQNAIDFDFHPLVVGAGLLPWWMWMIENKKWGWVFLFMPIIGGFQENMWLIMAIISLGWYVWKNKQNGQLLVIAMVNLTVLLVVIAMLIPRFGLGAFIYTPNIVDVERNLLSGWKTKGQVFLLTTLSFASWPWLTINGLVWGIGEMIVRFLFTSWPQRWTIWYQYNVFLAPMLAWATVDGMVKFKQVRWAIFSLLVGMVVSNYFYSPPLGKLGHRDLYDLTGSQRVVNLLKKLPNDASVATTNNIGAQIAERDKIFLLTHCLDLPKSGFKEDIRNCYREDPDWIVVDFGPTNTTNAYYPGTSEQLLKRLNQLVDTGKYDKEVEGTTYFLKKR